MKTTQQAQFYLNEMVKNMPALFYHDIFDVSRTDGSVLNYLKNASDEVCAGDLTEELHVSTARTAALLKRMENQGLITRHPSKQDRRRTIVEITPKGLEAIEDKNAKFLEKIETFIEQVGTEDLDTFIEVSRKINETGIF